MRAACTSCGRCQKACPEAILIAGPAGTPAVDFNRGACSFCGACAEACEDGVFADTRTAAWTLSATIGAGCLLSAGIACRSCTDACDEEALRFDLSIRPVGAIRIATDLCTGCGACVATCPVKAISLERAPEAAA